MKTLSVCLLIALLGAMAVSARATPLPYTFSFNENCSDFLTVNSVPFGPVACVPIARGGIFYEFSLSPVAGYLPSSGNIGVYDSDGTTLSDVIEFSGTQMYFYSLDSNGDLADVGSIQNFVVPPITLFSVNEDVNGNFTFNSTFPNETFYGTSSPTPEPASIILGAAGLSLLVWRRCILTSNTV